MSSPLVSVLMPVHNADRYLVQAVESILKQTFQDFELVVVDDGSTDQSLRILRSLHARDQRVRILSRPNTGIVGALNDGLAIARGDYIARMDADDLAEPNRLERQVAYLNAHPETVAVGSWIRRIDQYGCPAGEFTPPTEHAEIEAAYLRGVGNAITHPAAMIRRQALEAIDGWAPQYQWVEDLHLFLRLAEVGQLANLPEFLLQWRRHPRSVSTRHYESMRRRQIDVLQEAYARRGIADRFDPQIVAPEISRSNQVPEMCRRLACYAIHHRNRAVACRHAFAALWRQPWSVQSWRVMVWALRSKAGESNEARQSSPSRLPGESGERRPQSGQGRYCSQNGEDIIAWNVLAASTGPRYFVEVGVIDGVRFSNTFYFEQQGWRGLCVEAHPDFVERVRRNRPGSEVVHAAVMDKVGDAVTFYADPRGDLSTIVLKDEQQMRRRFGADFHGYSPIQVPARTLDHILEEVGAPVGLELLSIDIEGAEMAALRGLDLDRWQPRLLIVECEEQGDQAALNSYFTDRGYRFARRVGLNNIYTRRRLDAWRVRLARVARKVTHAANPVDPGAADRMVTPSSYESRRQYVMCLLRNPARAA